MRRIAVLSACVLVGGLLGPSTALATENGGSSHAHDRWIAVEDGFAVVLPDGQTFTDEDPPMDGEDEEFAPPVGTRLFISEVLYEAEHGNARGAEVGRSHIECTAQVVELTFACDLAFVLDEGSQLHGSVVVDFGDQTETEPLQFDIAVTGGTGAFKGATGEVSLLDISNPDDPAGEMVTLYETHLG